jgi:hypothetical protein
MDPSQDRRAEDRGVAEIRREIEGIRLRIAETIDALEYKADVGSRLGDKLSATASTVTATVRKRTSWGSRSAAQAPVDTEGTAMASKERFTDDEWARMRRAPFVAGMAISLADPGGPIELAKETIATLKAASGPTGQQELLVALSEDIQRSLADKQKPLEGFKVDDPTLLGERVLGELREVAGIVGAKASPEETAAFGDWMVAVAQAAADAAKEGGFMGFGAEQVSAGESSMISRLREAVGT